MSADGHQRDELKARSRWLVACTVLYIFVYAILFGLLCIIGDRFFIVSTTVGFAWILMTYGLPVLVVGIVLMEAGWGWIGRGILFSADSMLIALMLLGACVAGIFILVLPALHRI